MAKRENVNVPAMENEATVPAIVENTVVETESEVSKAGNAKAMELVTQAAISSVNHEKVLHLAGCYAASVAIFFGNVAAMQYLFDNTSKADKLSFVSFLKNCNKKHKIFSVKMDAGKAVLSLDKSDAAKTARKELRDAAITADALADALDSISWVTEKQVSDAIREFDDAVRGTIKRFANTYAEKEGIIHLMTDLNRHLGKDAFTTAELESLIKKGKAKIAAERAAEQVDA